MQNKKLTTSILAWQVVIIISLLVAGYFLVQNIQLNLSAVGIKPSFLFLDSSAGFNISESIIPVTSSDSYYRVLFAGFLNTILLSIVCIVGATLVGVCVGILRTSSHWLGSKVAGFYIEIMRNLPKLLILLALYLAVINTLPTIRENWVFFSNIHISNRSINFPILEWGNGFIFLLCLISVWFFGLLVARRIAKKTLDKTGRMYPTFWPSIVVLMTVFGLAILVFDVHFSISYPVFKGFDFTGGGRISIQFLVLWLALSLYHGGQVAELVRGAIEAVPKGQFEAAKASGLGYTKMMRLVILPQSLRIIIPPMGNQYLNISKNTSIALAVGYSDLVSVMTTSINQTFRPIELMTITMLTYLFINLVVSSLLNRYNSRINLNS
ncbi:amino acid ABC transporter permease [Vibrio sp. RC27]